MHLLKTFFKSFIKVICIFCIVFLLFAAFLAIDRKLAEHRAYEFCESAVQAEDSSAIRAILSDTEGVKNPMFIERSISVNFPHLFTERFVCNITLDASGKPSEMEVIHKD